MTDIEIAQAHEMKKIVDVAAKAGIDEKHLELYGNYKAKLDLTEIRKLPRKAKLILVTAISPTPAGEGKTTTSVGLADALNKLGKNTMVCLREPSLGPVFGVKGGAAGGGYAQVVPMEDINLHFTGDFHATSSTALAARPAACPARTASRSPSRAKSWQFSALRPASPTSRSASARWSSPTPTTTSPSPRTT